MNQTKLILNSRVKPLAEELLLITGLDNFSSLFFVLLTRYGYHLKNSWVVGTSMPAVETTVKLSSPSEPSVELTQGEDPVILRMARLVEEF